jgi:uroporphyrinogen decarboxylase
VVRAIKEAGGYVIKHTDGDIWKIMDMLISTGVDVLGPLEPAYMDLARVRRYSGSKVGVMGNIDLDLLSRGTEEDVRAATRELLTSMRGLGGHILSSGNTISSSVKPENFMAMINMRKECV